MEGKTYIKSVDMWITHKEAGKMLEELKEAFENGDFT